MPAMKRAAQSSEKVGAYAEARPKTEMSNVAVMSVNDRPLESAIGPQTWREKALCVSRQSDSRALAVFLVFLVTARFFRLFF